MNEISFRLGPAEIATIVATTCAVILWFQNYFQTKKEAKSYERSNDERVGSLEKTIKENGKIINDINANVAYIKGRLEPK
jgi:hypothetical protein